MDRPVEAIACHPTARATVYVGLIGDGAATGDPGFLFKTTKGYELRAAGFNLTAARYAGISAGGSIILAMIERGHIPLAETHQRRGASSRSMSLGIIVCGLGFALMTIIGIAAGTPSVGVGVGGSIVILGAAFIVRSLVVRPDSAPAHDARPSPPAPPIA